MINLRQVIAKYLTKKTELLPVPLPVPKPAGSAKRVSAVKPKAAPKTAAVKPVLKNTAVPASKKSPATPAAKPFRTGKSTALVKAKPVLPVKLKKAAVPMVLKKKIAPIKPVIKKKPLAAPEIIKATALRRAAQNPIISPRPENSWESWQTFNPGAVIIGDKVYFVYRAMGEDGISRLGYAMSSDGVGIDERLSYPVYNHDLGRPVFNLAAQFSGGGWGGAEDPRLVHIAEDDTIYMTYTACGDGLRVGLTSIKLDKFLNQEWDWKAPVLISHPEQTHKNWILFPEKINGKYAIIHSLKPEIQIEYLDNLDFEGSNFIQSLYNPSPVKRRGWDKVIRGAGAPPIKTKDGWLLFYHAMDDDWSKYKVGVMLLDLNNPGKILYRAQQPVLEPEEVYENSGFKPGVVYVSGAVVKDGQLLVYYGGSDNHVCVATADLEEFLGALKKQKEPKLRFKK